MELREKLQCEEAKEFYLATLEERMRVLGEEHRDTLASLKSLGVLLDDLEDYAGALNYYQQALREKVLGKTHPDTLDTIIHMAITY